MTERFKFKPGDRVKLRWFIQGREVTGTVEWCRFGYGGDIFPLVMVRFDRRLGGLKGAEYHQHAVERIPKGYVARDDAYVGAGAGL